MAINNKTISSWVRQARHRAKKYNINSDLSISDILTIVETDPDCAYCGEDAHTLDRPFPLTSGGFSIPANVVLCCQKCKSIKNNNDLLWMFTSGLLSEDQYIIILQKLFKRRGGDQIKQHVRHATGLDL